METTWKSAYELALAIEDRVRCGHKRIVLTPSTALWFAREVQNACARRPIVEQPDARFQVDMFAKGSRILEVDADGDILEIVAWARSSTAARAAFDFLCGYDPNKSFEQRRGAWVEASRIVKPDG